MDLVSYSLATLADTRSYLGFPDSSKDEQIKLFLNIATDSIEEYCGRRFASTIYTDEEYDGDGEYELILKQYPVITFTSLEKNGAWDNSDDWEDVDTAKYWVDLDTGIVTGTCKFSKGKQNYRANYTAGFATIPYDLQFAAMETVRELFMGRSTGGEISPYESESLGDHKVVFMKASQTNTVIQKVLDKYKRINL